MFETTLMTTLVVYSVVVVVRCGHQRCYDGRGKGDGVSRLNPCLIMG